MSEITKQALAQSLKNLMNTTPLGKITINDIVKECKVNRRTFYYHFQDIYALLEWIFKNEVGNVMEENITYKTWQEGFLRIFYYLNENRKMVLNTYNSIARDKLETHLYSAVYNLVLNVVDEITLGKEVSEKGKGFVVNFYKVALVGLLLEWIRKNMIENPEQIIYNLNKIIIGDTHKALLEFKIP
ncbi:TetR/AcrR family transcriptional regulator C-terminal domain-containing protein [Clostridium sp.]|uniref:TetR/AcrR family transcriptional regulator C-terminal domain-containing protein n=1 Tax=Clostridium sp. TaxID=1506 RepID=UPI001A4DEDAB|nr:TetR/AcrR family transcriptional regulator C-terminal domain-containing protein [Clostridium sp.]MBK5243213.1 TetR/AcrR family transcriptional regulator C-terminal domain-containing protein [Clostridium sp.]